MFNAKIMGVDAPAYCFLALLGLASVSVLGRPQNDGRPQVEWHPDKTAGLALKFSPELLFENTLESAASPASIYPHFPPSAVNRNTPPANRENPPAAYKGNALDDTDYTNDRHSIKQDRYPGGGSPKNQAGSSTSGADSGTSSRSSNINNVNNNVELGWPMTTQKFSNLQNDDRQDSLTTEQPQGRVRSSYESDALNSDFKARDAATRIQVPGVHWQSGTSATQPQQQPLMPNRFQPTGDVPLKDLVSAGGKGSLGSKEALTPRAHHSVYPSPLNQESVSSEVEADLDVDGLYNENRPQPSKEEDLGRVPLFHERFPPPPPFQPNGKQALPTTVQNSDNIKPVPWNQIVSNDIDVDRPVVASPAHAISEKQQVILSGTQQGRNPTDPLGFSQQRDPVKEQTAKEIDLESLDNPFSEEDDDEMEGEVPLELALQVIQAMKAEPAWKQYIGAGWEGMQPYWEDDDDEDDEYYGNAEESDEYDDWIPPSNMSPQNSRLITLIIQTIGVTENEAETKDNDMDIWQILSNFPFTMLLGRQNVEEDDDYYSEEYDEYYDEDDYYEEDEDDEYDEDDDYEYYDDEYYDDEEYEDEDDEEEVNNKPHRLKPSGKVRVDDNDDDNNDDDDDDDENFAVYLVPLIT